MAFTFRMSCWLQLFLTEWSMRGCESEAVRCRPLFLCADAVMKYRGIFSLSLRGEAVDAASPGVGNPGPWSMQLFSLLVLAPFGFGKETKGNPYSLSIFLYYFVFYIIWMNTHTHTICQFSIPLHPCSLFCIFLKYKINVMRPECL